LGAGHAKAARFLIGVGSEQTRYIIEFEAKFAVWVERAHGFQSLCRKLGYYKQA
jgi:hypothetical protein